MYYSTFTFQLDFTARFTATCLWKVETFDQETALTKLTKFSKIEFNSILLNLIMYNDEYMCTRFGTVSPLSEARFSRGNGRIGGNKVFLFFFFFFHVSRVILPDPLLFADVVGNIGPLFLRARFRAENSDNSLAKENLNSSKIEGRQSWESVIKLTARDKFCEIQYFDGI